jgi:metal-responsive CopG/Arc/MetJ family transcriptional regulator
LEQIDKIAQNESRTRSELIREAARIYKEYENIKIVTAKEYLEIIK